MFSSGDYPAPRAVLTGHDHEVVCVSVCAELGLVISGAKGLYIFICLCPEEVYLQINIYFNYKRCTSENSGVDAVNVNHSECCFCQSFTLSCFDLFPQRARASSTLSQGTCSEPWRVQSCASSHASSRCLARDTASSTMREAASATSA